MAKKKCPSCSSSKVWNYGKRKDGVPQFKCGSCKKQFTEKTGSAWARFRTPKEIIVAAMAIRFVGRASLRGGSFLLKLIYGCRRSNVAVFHWEKLLEPIFGKVHTSYRKRHGKTWRIDEVFVKMKGAKSEYSQSYVYVVSDQKGNILGVHVSDSRDSEAVERVLSKIQDPEAGSPKFVITDEHKSYPEPIKFNLPGAKHVRTGFELKRVQRRGKKYRFSVNPHERLNGDIRALLYGRRGFKSFESANRTMDMYRMQQVAAKQGRQDWFWNSILRVK